MGLGQRPEVRLDERDEFLDQGIPVRAVVGGIDLVGSPSGPAPSWIS